MLGNGNNPAPLPTPPVIRSGNSMSSQRDSMQRLKAILLGAVVVLVVAGSSLGPASAQQDDTSGDAELHRLNQGYSLLYGDVSGLANADKVFLVKFGNAATQQVVTDTADYMAELTGQLEQLARDYPSLRLDLKPLPKIERDKQGAATAARIKSFAPVVGRTGPDFERTLLLTLSGGLNQMRHLARVMAQAERSTPRRKLLSQAESRLDTLHADIEQVLKEHYFK